MKKAFVSILVVTILLLSLGARPGFAIQAATGEQVALKGSFQAVENDVVVWPTIYVDENGSGNSTFLGLYREHLTAVVQNNAEGVGYAVASARFTAANGDILYTQGTGVGRPTATPGVNHIVENFTITGGTGRFQGVTGKISIDRYLTLATGVSSGTIQGTLTLPAE
ncbi:MAG TPA: hypothetical protein VF498_09245, partial [Anaerolineales bacterium]